MVKYNEDIRNELTAARDALNARLAALSEYARSGSKYKDADLQSLMASISVDPEWGGAPRPEPEQQEGAA